jgi:hypothetical protein
LKQLRPELPVLVLSMHPEDQYAKRMLSDCKKISVAIKPFPA